jgi:hypothetical protein
VRTIQIDKLEEEESLGGLMIHAGDDHRGPSSGH